MPCFWSCDWGTTSFRLRRVAEETGRVVEEWRQASGVAKMLAEVKSEDRHAREAVYEEYLRRQLLAAVAGDTSALEGTSVWISGMATSSVGWRELPYARVPFCLDGAGLVHESFELCVAAGCQVIVHLISGVQTGSDIMRGEETEIMGLFGGDEHPIARDGIVVMPGSHSKHVRVRDREVISFRTYMTGELFDVLAHHSLLRASLEAGALRSRLVAGSDSEGAFIAGVSRAHETGLAESLFQTRVRTVLDGVLPSVNTWYLSGLLIGSELADLIRKQGDLPVLLAASEQLSPVYQLAFDCLGRSGRVQVVAPTEVALAAVRGHWTLMKEWARARL